VKIILVHNAYQQPGGEDVVFEQECGMLERAGHQVIPYRRSNWDAEAYHRIRLLGLAKRTVWSSDTRRDFAKLLAQEKPDLVHVHNTFVMISPSIYSACTQARVPVVQTLHNYRLLCLAANFFRDGKVCEQCLGKSLLPGVEHACYRHSYSASAVVAVMLTSHRLRHTWQREVSCFIALSEFARNKFVAGGLPAEKIFVKPNFVSPDPGPRSVAGDYALFVGRLSPRKRIETVVAAWKHLPRSIPLHIVGDGSQREQLKLQAAREGLTNIHFKGQLSREESLAAIQNARFLVFASEWYENFPVTIAESFACGTPVISSRLGAMQEIVSDGRTGLFFTPADSEDLAAKVEWAWTHPEQLRTMGLQARCEYEAKYTAEKNYPQLMEIYNRALKSRPEALDFTGLV
jgi:glycosyltransferase involved in cell wall biosynthesis